MIARLKFRALIWYVANGVILLLSAIAFVIYSFYFTVNNSPYNEMATSGTSTPPDSGVDLL